ncbi:MAG: Spy/CpxP family protein refolding chaperone [Gammaproteobacteria bacterium]
MHKTLLTLAIVLTFPLTVAAFPGGQDPDAEEHRQHRLERLTRELKLTDEQKTKVEALFKEQHDKFKLLHEETRIKLGKVLSPEQMTQMDDLKKQRRERWQHKKGMEKPE